MKKRWLLVLVLVVLVFGCREKVVLTDVQTVACNSAAQHSTCDRLTDLNLVTPSQCCSALGKCCGSINGKVIAWTGMLTAQSSLSDIQVAVCQSASVNSNCDKISEIGIVSREDCCSAIGLCCFSVSLDEFKSVLLQSIVSYFSPNPTLAANELKDMIHVYFASADVVDLSVVGGFSGERLIDIYNKAKGYSSTPTCFDGIQNEGETGVDCGGPCPACVVTHTCSSVGGSCKPNACSTYTNCADLSSGQCDSGNCCSGSCTPTSGEVLPWNWGSDGRLHVIYGSPGQKKTYILRVPSGTTGAGAHFFAYVPDSSFKATFTCLSGYKWRGYDRKTWQIRYSGDFGVDLTPYTITPTPTDGFVPPGDYVVEITWEGSGPILITTARR